MKGYELTEQDRERLENDFVYHQPVHEQQVVKYQQVRDCFRELAEFIMRSCPPSRERSVALTQLELANFEANAAIARHETADDYKGMEG